MGTVYLAEPLRIEKKVAIKVLAASLAEQPRAARRFEAEGRLISRVEHPNVVEIYDFGLVGGRDWDRTILGRVVHRWTHRYRTGVRHAREAHGLLLDRLVARAVRLAYCTDVLNLSRGATYKRIHAARAARKHPVIFELVAAGRLHLSSVCLLAPHLTADNGAELLEEAAECTKRQVEKLLAKRFPKPDVETTVRALPRRRGAGRPQPSGQELTLSRGAGPGAQQAQAPHNPVVRRVPPPARPWAAPTRRIASAMVRRRLPPVQSPRLWRQCCVCTSPWVRHRRTSGSAVAPLPYRFVGAVVPQGTIWPAPA